MSVFEAPTLTRENFTEWKRYLLKPSTKDGVEAVGFRTTLWEAVVDANGQNKPILLWAMNGHPMACT